MCDLPFLTECRAKLIAAGWPHLHALAYYDNGDHQFLWAEETRLLMKENDSSLATITPSGTGAFQPEDQGRQHCVVHQAVMIKGLNLTDIPVCAVFKSDFERKCKESGIKLARGIMEQCVILYGAQMKDALPRAYASSIVGPGWIKSGLITSATDM